MPFEKSIDFDIINLNDINEDELNTPEGMNKIANNIMLNVNGAITRASGDEDRSLFADKTNIFERTFIGKNSVNSLLDKTERKHDKKFSKIQRNQLGSFMIARAILDKTDVSVVHYEAESFDEKKKINNLFDNLTPPSMTFWEKLLAFFGIESVKPKIVQETKKEQVKQHLSALEADVKENHNERLNKIVADNYELAEKLRVKYQAFKDNSVAEQRIINDLYFKAMPLDAFKDETKEKTINNFKASGSLDARTLNITFVSAMLKKGYSLKEACDPNFLGGRVEVAEEIGKIANLMSSEDKEKVAEGNKLLGEIFYDGAKNYLQQPTLDKEDIDHFYDSKNPYYLTAISTFGHVIFDHLENTGDLSDPESQVFVNKLLNASQIGMISPITQLSSKFSYNLRSSSDPENNELGRKNLCEHVMYVEAHKQCCNQIAFKPGNTIDEYITANQDSAHKSYALMFTLPAFVKDCMVGENDEPIKLTDVMENKVSVFDRVKNSQLYNNEIHSCLQNTYKQGTFSQIEARVGLAINVAKAIGVTSGEEYSQTTINKIANKLMHEKNFLKETDFEPKKINELKNDSRFVIKLAKDISYDSVEKPKANENSQKLNEAEHKKTSERQL